MKAKASLNKQRNVVTLTLKLSPTEAGILGSMADGFVASRLNTELQCDIVPIYDAIHKSGIVCARRGDVSDAIKKD